MPRGGKRRPNLDERFSLNPLKRWSSHHSRGGSEFERSLIRERTKAGLEAAVARGRCRGRPVIMTPERVELAQKMRDEGKSYREIGEMPRVGASTVQLHLSKSG